MVAARSHEAPGAPTSPAPDEQRMLLYGVRFQDYVALRDVLDGPGLRMTYCKGRLELMSPGRNHERWKKMVGRLVELWALEKDVPLYGYGSTTFKKEAKERGAEPDECYRVGNVMTDEEIPDFVIEVVATAPLLDKLEVYDGLEVPEVWIYRDHAFAVYARKAEGGYERQDRSRFVPALDLATVVPFVEREDQHAALLEWRRAVRSES